LIELNNGIKKLKEIPFFLVGLEFHAISEDEATGRNLIGF
jgi:hypothetical protein